MSGLVGNSLRISTLITDSCNDGPEIAPTSIGSSTTGGAKEHITVQPPHFSSHQAHQSDAYTRGTLFISLSTVVYIVILSVHVLVIFPTVILLVSSFIVHIPIIVPRQITGLSPHWVNLCTVCSLCTSTSTNSSCLWWSFKAHKS